MLKVEKKCVLKSVIRSGWIQYSAASAAGEAGRYAKLILESSNPRRLAQRVHSSNGWSQEVVNSILKLLWNHGPKAIQFFRLLDSHPSYTHSASAFHHAIDISARMRDYPSLWALLTRMRLLSLGPTPKTFSIITERLLSSGKEDTAVRVFLTMHQHGCPQDLNSFNTFLDVLCKSHRAESAYTLLRMLRDRFQPDTVTYNIIVNGFCLIKRTPKALQILNQMLQRGLDPNLVTYNTMLKGYFRARQLDEAWGFFLQMKRRKLQIDVVTYTTVVHGCGVAGHLTRAQKVFNQMIDAGVLPSVATYNALIQAICKKGTVENAVMLFEKMLLKGYMPNVTTYNLIIRGLYYAGKTDEAIKYMNRMKTDDCEPNIHTYNVVIRYYCESGEAEKGLDIFESMGGGDCLPNLDTYNILIKAMFARKKSDDVLVAGRLLVEMVDRGFVPQKFIYNRVLNGLLLTGNQEFAREILRQQSQFGRIPIGFKI